MVQDHFTDISSFKDIKFGEIAAEYEIEQPLFLREGFFDDYQYTSQIMDENKFLIIGSKGSGKSALGYRIELMSIEKNESYAVRYDLSDFIYHEFSKIIPSKEAKEIRFQNDWEYILLVAFLANFSIDRQALLDNLQLKHIVSAATDLGLLPSKDLKNIAKITKSNTFSLKLPKVFEYSKFYGVEEIPSDASMLYDSLKNICYSLVIRNKHLIIIDGLDDVLIQERLEQKNTLGALISAADKMNRTFRSNCINAKVIVLCRSDLFNELPGPNNNKIKQASSVTLNWYQNCDPSSSNLAKLINLRAKVSFGREVNVFKEFFPPSVSQRGRETIRTLFDMTRHTPRDVIQLMCFIQKNTTGASPSVDEIWEGIKEYSKSYFLSEIIDELKLYLSMNEITLTKKLLGEIGKPEFTYDEFKSLVYSSKKYSFLDHEKILDCLFSCSAIGNFDPITRNHTFKFRNVDSDFKTNQDIIIQKGMWTALSMKSFKFDDS